MIGIEETLDHRDKSLPSKIEGLTTQTIGKANLNILNSDCLFPVAVLKKDRVAENNRWMQRFCDHYGVELWPHGKTTLSSQIFAAQMASGARGFTAATVAHVRMYRSFGIDRIFLANQLVGKADIAEIIDILKKSPHIEFYALVDSIEGVVALREAVDGVSMLSPLRLLIEVGSRGFRAGVLEHSAGLAIARALAEIDHDKLPLYGIEAYEGVHQGAGDGEVLTNALLTRVLALADECEREGLFATDEPILSAGGSYFFDLCVMRLRGQLKQSRLLMRSGCYVIHDHGLYGVGFDEIESRGCELPLGRLEPSLEVWTIVQSVPEPGRAIVTMGKRDVGHDAGMPMAVAWYRYGEHDTPQLMHGTHRVSALFDQHACLDGPDNLKVGDLVGFGISHPCTTFDKWRSILLVESDYRVTGAITTHF
ncbi:alanine racemase [Parasphingorhabdus sp.]|uniref:alanine racemase n=1 Tax=Parasphingorhabdus sp. TaxID=2709688 RepID=UPI0032EB3862